MHFNSGLEGIAIDNDANKIYYAGNYTDRIYRANLDGSGEVSLISGINPSGIAIDGTTSKLFWCDSSSGKIFSSGLDGSSVKSIVTGLNEPTSIASYVSNTSPNEPENTPPVATAQSVSGDEDTSQSITLSGSDPDGDELTYAIASGPSNGSATLSGNTVTYTPNENYSGSDSFTFTVSDETITSAPATVSISVNPVTEQTVSYVIWTDKSSGKIQRSNLDGTDIVDLVTGLNRPVDIAVDATNEKIYWTEEAGSIKRANLDGSSVETIKSGLSYRPFIALDDASGYLFWSLVKILVNYDDLI